MDEHSLEFKEAIRSLKVIEDTASDRILREVAVLARQCLFSGVRYKLHNPTIDTNLLFKDIRGTVALGLPLVYAMAVKENTAAFKKRDGIVNKPHTKVKPKLSKTQLSSALQDIKL